MAAKEMEMKKETQKGTEKKRRRLKRSVRKTFGAIFLASSIAVAAIPTEGLQAATNNRTQEHKVTLVPSDTKTLNPGENKDSIPIADDKAVIYSTGDGMFQFVYLNSDGKDAAMILKYNKQGSLEGNKLVIPDTVEAYAKYTSETSAGIYVAVDNMGSFLYFQEYVPVFEQGEPVYELDPDCEKCDGKGWKCDENGPIQAKKLQYTPCYANSRDKWKELTSAEFYYDKNEADRGKEGYTPDYDSIGDGRGRHRISEAMVLYIGNQTLEDNDDKSGWKIGERITKPEQGVFYNASNIRYLEVGVNLSGIGNYAFYHCGSLQSITFGNGMQTIGNYAFADCTLLEEVKFAPFTQFSILGDHAFSNCQSLKSFMLPNATSKVGDSAFENCYVMTSVNLMEAGDATGLSEMGYDVFKGCANLKSVSFPRTYTESVDVTMFQGCEKLEFIETLANDFNLTEGDDDTFKFEQFKNMVPSTFYLKGMQDKKLHKTATAQEIAYSYFDFTLDQQVYELTMTVEEDGAKKRAVYRVTADNELVYCDIQDNLKTVELPARIGPYGISSIDSGTFRGNCNIKRIVIPSTIIKIEKDAFKGCHHLVDVIWDNPNPNLVIESGAFKTQDTSLNTCSDKGQISKAELNFIGPISDTTKPFLYAMEASENINYGEQPLTYITYYSGWPSNLEVRYDPETDKNTLVDYPSFTDLGNGKYKVKTSSLPGGYAYITAEDEKAATDAYAKYTDDYKPKDDDDDGKLTQNELQILNAVFNIVLPTGIEAIATVDDKGTIVSKDNENARGLFEYKEEMEPLLTLEKNGNVLRKTITANGLAEVADRAFAGCKYLTSVTLSGNTKSLGAHVFEDCEELTSVLLPATVETLGIRPFAGCTKLSNVNFGGGPYFVCDNSIIYELGEGRVKEKLVEYLCGRESSTVKPEEVKGILELYPEAFMGTNVGSVDLSSSLIEDVPVSAFQDTLGLYSVTLPEDTCKSISRDAFSDSAIKVLHIPDSVSIINNDAFRDVHDATGNPGTDGKTDLKQLEIECAEGSAAAVFAKQNNIKWSPYVPKRNCTVTFVDWDDYVLKVETVEAGHDATPPTKEEMAKRPRPGWTHEGWDRKYTNVISPELTTKAIYKEDPKEEYTITYYYDDLTVYLTQPVLGGRDAIVPNNPPSKRTPGAEFQGWVIFGGDDSGKAPVWTNIRANMSVIAVYKGAGGPGAPGSSDPNTSGSPNPNASGSPNPNASGSPNPNASGSPDPNASGSPNPNASGSPGPGNNGNGTGTFYTLTVQNGSGSGSYVEGAQPVIIANNPASGQEFDYWSVSPADVKIASTVLSASIVTMPAKDVTVTAHFKAKSGSSGSGTTGSGNNSQRPNGNTGVVSRGGTTVVIDKNGLSNTGVVSATVHGSSDNFTIKISDSAVATEAALRALMAEYGDNLDNIKFFPMDISLYDSTGTTKITDTTGLSVSVTLPLPDSLITYAGNNRVASVVNDKLERLSARFTTIQGVSCITFTAEHFSPYVIYVNTGDLSSGLVSDETPKTGDFIHPKWFLSIALACLSFVFFIQQDTKKQKKVKVKVRA